MSEFMNIHLKTLSKSFIQSEDNCNKHPEKKGEYFQLECPWVKFCDICALNIALCGKKIQKDLTASQTFNKITLNQILKDLQKCVKNSETQHTSYNLIIKQTQSIRDYFTSYLTKIQQFIAKLSQYKRQLEQLVYDNLTKELKGLFEKQNTLVSKKFEVNKSINRIQCDFTRLLEQAPEKIMNDQIKACRSQLSQCQQIFLNTDYQKQMIKNITQIKTKFEQNLQKINDSKITIQFQHLKNQLSLEKYDNFNEESIIQSMDGIKMGLDWNSIDASEGVAKAEIINDRNPLIEINGNRRNSRVALQLKVRCHTKSAKKLDRQRIEIDVRESVKQNNFRMNVKS